MTIELINNNFSRTLIHTRVQGVVSQTINLLMSIGKNAGKNKRRNDAKKKWKAAHGKKKGRQVDKNIKPHEIGDYDENYEEIDDTIE